MRGQKDDLLQSFPSSYSLEQRTRKYTNEIGENAKKWIRRHLLSVRKRASEGLMAGSRAPTFLTTYFYDDATVCSPTRLIPSWTVSLLELLKMLECLNGACFILPLIIA
jgi:hypothetical protein